MMAVRAHQRAEPEVLRYDEAPRLVTRHGEALVEQISIVVRGVL
jgi:hypothetical protein